MRSMIEEMNHAIDAYADVESNEQEIKQLSEEGDQAISYITDWLEELEQAWNPIRTRDVLLMDTIRKKVEPFQEEDDRCIFEFLQQIAPLDGLPQRMAVEMLTQELLDPETKEVNLNLCFL